MVRLASLTVLIHYQSRLLFITCKHYSLTLILLMDAFLRQYSHPSVSTSCY